MTVKQLTALRKATSLTLFVFPATLLLMNVGGNSSTRDAAEPEEPEITIETFGSQRLGSEIDGLTSEAALAHLGNDGKEMLAGEVFFPHAKEVRPFEKDVLAPEDIPGLPLAPSHFGIPRLFPPFPVDRRADRDTVAVSASRPANLSQTPLVPIPEPGAGLSAALCLGLLSLRRGSRRPGRGR